MSNGINSVAKIAIRRRFLASLSMGHRKARMRYTSPPRGGPSSTSRYPIGLGGTNVSSGLVMSGAAMIPQTRPPIAT